MSEEIEKENNSSIDDIKENEKQKETSNTGDNIKSSKFIETKFKTGSIITKKIKIDVETDNKIKKGQAPYHKIVVRRIPPTMTAETFLEQVSPLPDYNFFYFVKGDNSYGPNSFSRAYLHFINHNDIFDFKDKFDNYVFLDSKGNEYFAVVEFACFQRIPKKRSTRKKDNKCGTIDSDPSFIRFAQEYANQLENVDSNPKAEYSFQIKEDKKRNDFVSTPLVEYLNNRKQEQQRLREERREERRKHDLSRRRQKEEERRKKLFNKQMDKIKDKSNEPIETKHTLSEIEKVPDDITVTTTLTSKSFLNRVKARKYETPYRGSNSKTFVIESPACKPRFPQTERGRKDIYARDNITPARCTTNENKYNRGRKTYDHINKYQKNTWKQNNKEQMDLGDKNKSRKVENKSKDDSGITSEKQEDQQIKSEKKEIKDSESNGSKHNDDEKDKDDPRTQRRIRNKDRPTIQIYRPGMGRFSKERSKTQEPENK